MSLIVSLTRMGLRYYDLCCHVNKVHFYLVDVCITEKSLLREWQRKKGEKEREGERLRVHLSSQAEWKSMSHSQVAQTGHFVCALHRMCNSE